MSSKTQKYGPGYKRAHIKNHEQRTAENNAEHLLPVVKEMAQRQPNLSLIDVGTGPGTIAISLAKYIPQGHIIGTDLSEEILERARELGATSGVVNLTFQQADVYKLPFDDGSFDIVHASQLLCHLASPVDALKEMLRVVKPGGVVSVKEVDIQTSCFWPELPGLLQFQDMMCQVHDAFGGSNQAGRQLLSWALGAGAKRDQIQAGSTTWCCNSPEERRMFYEVMTERLLSGAMSKVMAERKLATDEDVQAMVQAWQAWRDDESANWTLVNGTILIFK